MPSLEKRVRRRRRGSGILPALIVMLVLVAAVLVMMLMNSNPMESTQNESKLPFAYPENPEFVEQKNATVAPLVLGSDSTPAATPEVEITPEPTPEGTPQPIVEPGGELVVITSVEDMQTTAPQAPVQQDLSQNRLVPKPIEGDYFLPVFDRALRTPDDEMMIAVTIDDCDEVEQMNYIIQVGNVYDAQFTFFPTGDALMDPNMTQGFRNCAKKYGHQLENHSFGHKAEYRITSSELAIQLWKQAIATDYAVGDDYEQHFYRPYNNASVHDQRTHFYANKLGYLGIAGYTHSYKDVETAEELIKTLGNGKIYQFDMSDESMDMFEQFVTTASNKGYKLVTMNHLFGLNEDVIGNQLTIDQQTLITMEDYVPTYYDLKLNYRTNAVYALQDRLMDLGYMDMVNGLGERIYADGIYGVDTSVAVSEFQAEVGIVADGNATVETQQRLFAEDAPINY